MLHLLIWLYIAGLVVTAVIAITYYRHSLNYWPLVFVWPVLVLIGTVLLVHALLIIVHVLALDSRRSGKRRGQGEAPSKGMGDA